jgi:thiamine-phosphate pyrophosphorylase
VLRYAITSRALFPGDDRQQQAALLHQAARWAIEGIDFIQLREKDLPAAVLANLSRKLIKILPPTTKLLINSRADIALATAAPGVHLTARTGELTPYQIRHLYGSAHLPSPLITVSCHTLAEVDRARDQQADAILFGPIFEKPLPHQPPVTGHGLALLHAACLTAESTPIYALGGITSENASSCIEAGAAGIAGIRLFHWENP